MKTEFIKPDFAYYSRRGNARHSLLYTNDRERQKIDDQFVLRLDFVTFCCNARKHNLLVLYLSDLAFCQSRLIFPKIKHENVEEKGLWGQVIEMEEDLNRPFRQFETVRFRSTNYPQRKSPCTDGPGF